MGENSIKKKQLSLRKYLRTDSCYDPINLKNIRIRNNLTRQDVVKETNLSYSTIEKLETGRTKSPEWTTMYSLAQQYHCCIGEFCNQNLNYVHCTDTEKTLLKLLRTERYDLSKIITILKNNSHANILEDLIKLYNDIELLHQKGVMP